MFCLGLIFMIVGLVAMKESAVITWVQGQLFSMFITDYFTGLVYGYLFSFKSAKATFEETYVNM